MSSQKVRRTKWQKKAKPIKRKKAKKAVAAKGGSMFKANVKKGAPEETSSHETHAKKEPVPAEITNCIEEGCDKPLAPGQTFVCADHIRTK
jgi:hypothetical protein